MAQTRPVRIGTRGSRLALWQANTVRDRLATLHALPPDRLEIVAIKTSGDRIQDRALLEAGGKGLFTKEIEEALSSGAIDLAVHSAKDMQTFLPAELTIGACLEREDARDALISVVGQDLADLPAGARFGTASLRREALLRRARPDVRIELLRGNVPTRLARVEAGEFDATLLAAAGLHRLGLQAHISAYLPLRTFPPACGQGAVAVECRADDNNVLDLLRPLDHRATALAVLCERAFLAVLDGSCRTPIAGYAEVSGGDLAFSGVLLSPDGRQAYEARLSGLPEDAAEIGRSAGHEVRQRAPPEFLRGLGIG